MEILETALEGVFLLKRRPFADERGSFARIFDRAELEEHGLCADIAQMSLSANHRRGTLRGLHSLSGEFAEDKIVTCVLGSVFDVCVDVREGSATFGRWVSQELSAENGLAFYVPKGFAHGYVTLTDDVHLLYTMSRFYRPEAERGFMWDEPVFGIRWPEITPPPPPPPP
ncbi:MAG: dTDP-4-dehydrorhamnose 3,5-epimerase family protein, partial [Turicibacter sp.]|nr:dTDP-4-dehydrorhamnose 3,5-epimerase family protein [Turicibacter sp.]